MEKLYCVYPRTVVPKILRGMLPALNAFVKLYFCFILFKKYMLKIESFFVAVIPGEGLKEDAISQFIKDMITPMEEMPLEEAARQADDYGFNFGPCFRLMTKCWCGRGIMIIVF